MGRNEAFGLKRVAVETPEWKFRKATMFKRKSHWVTQLVSQVTIGFTLLTAGDSRGQILPIIGDDNLIDAVKERRYESAKQLLKAEPQFVNVGKRNTKPCDEPRSNGWTALHWAVQNDQLQFVNLLLDNHADPNTGSSPWVSPLALARSLDVAKRLIQAGANVNGVSERSEIPLIAAAHNGRSAVAHVLLENGADPKRADSHGNTALHHACLNGNPILVQLLVEQGVDIEAKNEDGKTPVWMAARSLEVVRFLIANGASIRETTPKGRTLLHEAVQRGGLEVARYLLDSGFEVNACDNHEVTPLHLAAEVSPGIGRFYFESNGACEIALVELLLAHGAKVDVRTKPKPDSEYYDEEENYDVVTPLALAEDTAPPPRGNEPPIAIPQCCGPNWFRNCESFHQAKVKIAAILRKHGAK
jgi:ankyrin repeat protein